MGSIWFPLLVVIGAAVVSASAFVSSKKPNPNHPLVVHPSKLGAWSFLIATLAYASAGFLLIREQTIFALVLAFIGLFACAIGYGAPRKK